MATWTRSDEVFEELARLRKAVRLADALDAMGYTDETVAEVTPGRMAEASGLAGVGAASPATFAVTLALLADRRLVRERLGARPVPGQDAAEWAHRDREDLAPD